jgi:hypothetical protein
MQANATGVARPNRVRIDFEGTLCEIDHGAERFAVAQAPSVGMFLPTPKILSAIKKNRSAILPGPTLRGGDPSLRIPSRTRALRTQHALAGNARKFARSQQALLGAPGVDKKTGAAIQRRVAPGEAF